MELRIFGNAEGAEGARRGAEKGGREGGRERREMMGELDFSAKLSLEQIISQLIALPGIGSWTAHYIAMRAFGEPDAFPAGDLILRRVASESGQMLTESQLLKRAEVWRPMRAYAALYLWTNYLASKNQ